MRRKLLLLVGLLVIILSAICLKTRPMRKASVVFLNQQEGQKIFDRPLVLSLIRSYRYKESVARSGGLVTDRSAYRDHMIDFYKQAVLEFTQEEKQSLLQLIMLDPRLRNENWMFLKVGSHVDWGFPFTLENVVVLPENVLQSIGTLTAKTLRHECIHIKQRKHQNEYDEFYKSSLGYRKSKKLQIPSSIIENTVTNPDGPDVNWIKKVGDDWYWSALMLQDGTEKPRGLAWKCIVNENESDVTVTKTFIPLTELTFAFDGHSNTYHPNEFVASLLST